MPTEETTQTRSGPGRPTKFIPQVRKRILEGIALGLTLEHASAYGGISDDTLLNWRKKGEAGEAEYAEFFGELKEAEAIAVAKWFKHIDAAAEEGTWQAAAWKAERRHPESYGRRGIEITGRDGNPIETVARVVVDWDGNGHSAEEDPGADSPVDNEPEEEKAP